MLGNIIYENLQFAQTFGKQQVDALLGELLDNIEPVHDVNGLNVEEVLSMADHTDQFIRHSQSSSSISSLNSHCSGSSFEQGYSSSASSSCNRVASTASLHVSESDPDYNVTLTQQRYTNIRQNIAPNSGSQPLDVGMDIDSCCGNSIMSGSDGTTPDFYQQQKPRFFIESNQPMPPTSHQHQATIISGGHHTFTVETNNDPMYANPSSKSAHCLLNRFAPPNQNGYQSSNDQYYQQTNNSNNMAYANTNGINGQPMPQMMYDDNSSSNSLTKSQSYPCYSYFEDDNGPPTLQSQQAFLNQSSSRY